MELNQALQLIDSAVASLTLNRQSHADLQKAVGVVVEYINKKEQEAKDIKDAEEAGVIKVADVPA